MNTRKSEAVIDNVEFIDLQPVDINPLMSKCVVKVLYVGQNRNESYIDKLTATHMSKTLRGCPIVGHYVEQKQDFGDHGDQMIIDGNGVTFNKLTKPYGFVAPDAKVWFQFFEDTDEYGNTVMREYLLTEGYLWTDRYPEAKNVLKNREPQSMELKEESMKGNWAKDSNTGLKFFIINDAIFSALCILGEDVEPCFEGSQFLEDVDSLFSKDSSFVKEFFTMVKELKNVYNNEGGLSMEDNKTPEAVATEQTEQNVENSFENKGENNELNTPKNENTSEEFVKKPEEEKKEDNKEEQSGTSKEENTGGTDKKEEDDEKEDKKKKPSANNNLVEVELSELSNLQEKLSELQNEFSKLQEENKNLVAFKNKVEDEEKEAMINSFYMLSDEDKKAVRENKANYSLEDIEKELSVICVRKKVNFDTDEQNEELPATIFNLDAHQVDNTPAWLKSVEEVRSRKN